MARFKIIECSGTPRQMGRQQGEALKESIMGIVDTFLRSDDLRHAGAGLVDPRRLLRIAGSICGAASRLERGDAMHRWRERIEGLAEGAGIGVPLAMGAQAIETIVSIPIATSQCTTIGVTPERSGGAGPLLLKNSDIGEILRPTTFLRISRPAGKLRSFEMIINMLAGSHIAMNETGLCVSYNYGLVRWYPRPALPPTIIVQYAVESFARTRQVVDWISGQRSTNGCILTVLDREGDLCVIEKAGGRTGVRRPDGGVTAATNHFLTADMECLNYGPAVVFGKRAPAALRGIRVQESNVRRLQRASTLVEKKKNISIADLKIVASDHDGKENGDGNTICRHHEAMMTLASIILAPKDGKILCCDTSPCKGAYEEIRPFD
jgi:hypothetical protein